MTSVPSPEESVELLASALRRDAQDLSLYAGFLLNTLSVALPADVVEVSRHRSMRDRVRGGEGDIVGVTVRLADRVFTLTRVAVGAKPTASVVHEVKGIALSTQAVPLDEWAHQVAAALVSQAQVSAAAAAALEVMLRPGSL